MALPSSLTGHPSNGSEPIGSSKDALQTDSFILGSKQDKDRYTIALEERNRALMDTVAGLQRDVQDLKVALEEQDSSRTVARVRNLECEVERFRTLHQHALEGMERVRQIHERDLQEQQRLHKTLRDAQDRIDLYERQKEITEELFFDDKNASPKPFPTSSVKTYTVRASMLCPLCIGRIQHLENRIQAVKSRRSQLSVVGPRMADLSYFSTTAGWRVLPLMDGRIVYYNEMNGSCTFTEPEECIAATQSSIQ